MANLNSGDWIQAGPITEGTAANVTNMPIQQSTDGQYYYVPMAGTAQMTSSFGTTYGSLVAAQRRMQEEYLEYQRAYQTVHAQQMEAWREFYMYGKGAFKAAEPEKLETKGLSAADRERLLEALPF